MKRDRKRYLIEQGRMTARRIVFLVVGCVLVILSAVVLMNLEPPPGRIRASERAPIYKPVVPKGTEAVTRDSKTPASAAPVTAGSSSITDADISYLSTKNLLLPVAGKTALDLRDSFLDLRSEGRQHLALDIMASQNTAVMAADDGVILKLYQNDKGGATLYQSDMSGFYVYYYAHLSSYAEGIHEGKRVNRGDVIAYVGDTGNAGAGNFHLHFAISKVPAPGKWSGGDPINPYPLLTGKQSLPVIRSSGQ